MTGGGEGRKPWDIERSRTRPDAGAEGDPLSPEPPSTSDDEEPLVLHERTLVLGDAQRRHRPGASSRAPTVSLGGTETRPAYAQDGPSLFWLVLSGGLLTILTLGLYRFWLTARLRRHYWNAVRIEGDPLEYTGTGLEKFLGFLMAIIILAVYLGLVNLVLTFVGLSYFQGSPVALQLSLLAIVPLLFFAQYRARRYILARTRWRGIRFGMDAGAWGYTLRAICFWALTLASLGLLYPFQQFRLARFMTERSWFGSLRFAQKGSWVGLFAYWVWLYVVVGIMAVIGWVVAADVGNPSTAVIGGTAMFTGYLALVILFMRYEVAAFRYMWSNRTLGGAHFTSEVTPAQIIGIYVGGSLLVALCTLLVTVALFAGLGGAGLAVFGAERLNELFSALAGGGAADGDTLPSLAIGAIGAAVLTYLVVIAFAFAFSHVFVVRPILRRKAETMIIHHVGALQVSRQRAHDRAAEAGGFADALGVDLGAGF